MASRTQSDSNARICSGIHTPGSGSVQSSISRAWWVAALLLCVPATLGAQTPAEARPPIVAMAKDSPGGTDDYYYLDLGDGTLTLVDQLRRDPARVRVQRMPAPSADA